MIIFSTFESKICSQEYEPGTGASNQDGIFQQLGVILAEELVLIHIYRFWTTSPQVGDLHIAHELAAGCPAVSGRPPEDATTQRPVPEELPGLLSQEIHCSCTFLAVTEEKGPVL